MLIRWHVQTNFCICILSFPLHAQMLDARKELFSDNPFFRESFIQQNKVKHFYGKISTKKELDIIRSSGEFQHYEFNTGGQLIRQYKVFSLGNGKKDTLFIGYLYNAFGWLIQLNKNDASGFFAYDYSYDAKGRVVKQAYVRIENLGDSRYHFIPGKRFVISEEIFTYTENTPYQTKKVYMNTYGLPYKEEILNVDAYGYLQSVEGRFMIGDTKYRYEYSYTPKGLLASKLEETNQQTVRTTYTYDEANNLLEENVYRNEKHATVKQYLLSEHMLVKALLIKDVPSNLITILEYAYTLYE